MKAVSWEGGQSFRLRDLPGPAAEPERIVVRVEAASVCGSDFCMDDFGVTPPLVLGHEVAGTVAEIGSGVSAVSVGDRVALDPVQRCGACWCCTHGVAHLCTNCRHLGWDATPGGWAEYVAVDAANAYAIPEGVGFVAASLVEPLAVCYQSFQRAPLSPGDRVLIIGDGPFGFLHAQLAAVLGAGRIILAGHHDQRLARIAAKTGAVTCNTHDQDIGAALKAAVDGPGVDVVIEASGSGSALNAGVEALRPRGTLVIFSQIWQPEALDMARIHALELSVLGCCRSSNAYAPCMDLMAHDRVDTMGLVDVAVPLTDFADAFDALRHRKAETFKAVLLPQGPSERDRA